MRWQEPPGRRGRKYVRSMSAATLLAAAIVGIGMMQQPAAAQDFDPEMLHDPIDPLSYLIYSKSFDGMPDLAREHAYSRLLEILSGRDNSPEFDHLSAGDRRTVLDILEDTKPDFRAWIADRRFEPAITP